MGMHASRDDYQRFHATRRRTMIALLREHVSHVLERGLDVGGGGDVAGLGRPLQENFVTRLYAVDQGEDVEAGRARGVQTEACDIDREPLPFPSEYFDLVLFASVIEHLYNPRFALNEIERVLRPGGWLVLEAPNAVSLGRRLDALAGRNPFRWFNEYNALRDKAPMEYCSVFYTAEEAEALLGDHFEIVARRYAMHNPPINPLKGLLRSTAATLNPRLSDCFFLLARRR